MNVQVGLSFLLDKARPGIMMEESCLLPKIWVYGNDCQAINRLEIFM